MQVVSCVKGSPTLQKHLRRIAEARPIAPVLRVMALLTGNETGACTSYALLALSMLSLLSEDLHAAINLLTMRKTAGPEYKCGDLCIGRRNRSLAVTPASG